MEIWFIRHGESVGNVDGTQADTPLTARGRAQAAALRERLEGVEFDVVVTSPLLRARETASIAMPDVDVRSDTRLTEWTTRKDTYIDPAELAKTSLEELLRRESDAETFERFQGRLNVWLHDVRGVDRVVAFSHYAVVRECVRAMSGGSRVLDDIPHAQIIVAAWTV